MIPWCNTLILLCYTNDNDAYTLKITATLTKMDTIFPKLKATLLMKQTLVKQ
jgi:hypothetical protein